MSRAKYLSLVFLTVATTLACDALFTVNQTQTTVVGPNASPSPSPTPTPAAGPTVCKPVTHVLIEGPSSAKVGEQVTLGATPYTGIGEPSPASCDLARVVLWSGSGPADLTGLRGYNPVLVPNAVGIVQVRVKVDNVESTDLFIKVE